jgi:hypothetical protein
MAVPSGSRKNNHVWAMDQAPIDGLSGEAWAGIWTGTRPVQFMHGNIGGKERCFELSFGKSAVNGKFIHLWENFRPTRTDEGGRIMCQFETAAVASETMLRFKYADIECIEIYGKVNLDIYVGGTKGPWYLVGSTVLQAEIGSPGSSVQKRYTKDTILRNFKKQSRKVSTKEFDPKGLGCSPEMDQAGTDKGFQLLLEWTGQMGVREIRMVMDGDPMQEQAGACKPPETCAHNIIDETGTVIT